MSNWVKTILFLIGSALLTHWIPSSFFRNLDTMVHEFGHAAATLALSGKVMYVELYANHSGVTYSTITKAWSIIPISLSGYMTASLFAWFLFAAYVRGKQRAGLQVTTLIAILSLVLFVRNPFGVAWLLGFIAWNVLLLLLGPKWLQNFYYLLLSFICLEESVVGPLSLTVYALQDPSRAGDATNLSAHTYLPAVLWALFFLAFALWCAKRSIQAFVGGSQRHSRAAVTPISYYE